MEELEYQNFCTFLGSDANKRVWPENVKVTEKRNFRICAGQWNSALYARKAWPVKSDKRDRERHYLKCVPQSQVSWSPWSKQNYKENCRALLLAENECRYPRLHW